MPSPTLQARHDSATAQSCSEPHQQDTTSAAAAPPAPPIPSYEAAVAHAPPPLLPAVAPPPVHVDPPDELPDYTVVDSNQMSFMIYGTFIYTPNGPAYQLSSLLDACISKIRIRRLRAEDVARIESGRERSVSFDEATTLYEAHDPPFLENEFFIHSRMHGGWQGQLQLRFGFRRWHVRQAMPQQPGVVPKPFLTCGKTGGLQRRIFQRKNELKPSEWKDTQGHVLATEVLKLEGGKMLPTIELSRDLDQKWRELMLALWVSRLWAGFGAGNGSW